MANGNEEEDGDVLVVVVLLLPLVVRMMAFLVGCSLVMGDDCKSIDRNMLLGAS